MSEGEKPLVWLHGEVRTPPFTTTARVEAGVLLRRLQQGEQLTLPHSRPMPDAGRRCHELRIPDEDHTWRIMYRIDPDAILILEVFSKKSEQTPKRIIEVCRARQRVYDDVK
ncbi:MAG: type II toxin-antitoxin system RelE/ParE family toxin [Gemmatimonadetes bacterium]|nr:type II toxin-antitoxin system RelE/ParE family toxin [Gemmatimonadota bacterium]